MLSLGVTLVMTPLSHAYTGYTSFRGAVYSTVSHIGLGATVCTNGYPNTLSHLESGEIPPRQSSYDHHAVFKDHSATLRIGSSPRRGLLKSHLRIFDVKFMQIQLQTGLGTA
ncbi:hypothetical protein [Klebsiella phage vB_KpnS-VAC51]|uniref:Uncharacterized protein n=1 Tax=Klebsiella phage vB_KpnS-VAC51 TaxID=2866698 RepID=A0AAE9C5K1_9CAUD|nr:hypothetical protein [Klebsiella phage vB_KpnS-VAC51]